MGRKTRRIAPAVETGIKVCRIAGFRNPLGIILPIQIRRDVPFVKTGCYEQYYTDAAA